MDDGSYPEIKALENLPMTTRANLEEMIQYCSKELPQFVPRLVDLKLYFERLNALTTVSRFRAAGLHERLQSAQRDAATHARTTSELAARNQVDTVLPYSMHTHSPPIPYSIHTHIPPSISFGFCRTVLSKLRPSGVTCAARAPCCLKPPLAARRCRPNSIRKPLHSRPPPRAQPVCAFCCWAQWLQRPCRGTGKEWR
jgi:hypothetical protein